MTGLTVTACGGGGSSSSSGEAATESSSEGSGEGASEEGSEEGSGEADIAYAEAQVKKFSAIPKFPNLPPVPAKETAGQKASLIPFSTAVPFIAQATDAAAEGLEQAGVSVQQYPSQGELSQIQQAFGNSISSGAKSIGLFSVSPETVGPQLTAADSAGIPVVLGHITPKGYPLAPHAAAQTPGPFYESGRLMADYVIANSKADADVLIVTSNEQLPARGTVKAIEEEFQERCGEGCSTTVVNVPIADWAQKLQSQTQSSLVSDPNINYIIPLYDSGVQFILPGITAAGATGRVKIVTFNGTPFVLNYIREGETVIADIGESTRWLGRALADQMFRVMTGTKPVEEETPMRIFDKSNVEEAGVPAKLGEGYGSADVTGYNKIWGVE
ncbi:MAG TPA: sugar ABC transporter substrate-binding protein [Solirubrobacterales bacterium]